MRPRKLTGKRRNEAQELLASGLTDREVAAQLGVSRRAVMTAGRAPSSGAAKTTAAATPSDDLAIREELRDTLLAHIRQGPDSIELARLTKELNATLDGIARITKATTRPDDDPFDEDAEWVMAKLRRFAAGQPAPSQGAEEEDPGVESVAS